MQGIKSKEPIKPWINAAMETFRARRKCKFFGVRRAKKQLQKYWDQGSHPAPAGKTLARVELYEKWRVRR